MLHTHQTGAFKWVLLAVSPLFEKLTKYVCDILSKKKFTISQFVIDTINW